MVQRTGTQKIYTKANWTDKALVDDGFLSYVPIKRISMARFLRSEEIPESLQVADNMLCAKEGYWIVYTGGKTLNSKLDYYPARLISPDMFAVTYRSWDDSEYKLTSTEKHLYQSGCKPYYKFARLWAKPLDTDTWTRNESALIPRGMWLCIGAEGEPWGMTNAWFQAHYLLQGHQNSTGSTAIHT